MVVVFVFPHCPHPGPVPSISPAFAALGWVFLAAIVVAAVLWFPVGYYNLTAVELIAGLLIFSWLIVLIRNLAAVDANQFKRQPATSPGARARCGRDPSPREPSAVGTRRSIPFEGPRALIAQSAGVQSHHPLWVTRRA